jgi:hypothetical protein
MILALNLIISLTLSKGNENMLWLMVLALGIGYALSQIIIMNDSDD